MARFTSSDGVDIYYQQWGARQPGPPVILQHGYVANARLNWVMPGIVRALTRAGRRVIALDARGHGRSGKPHESSFYGESRMALDIIALMDELGLDEVDLVGYSMGATVALLTAVGEKRIRRLVIGGIGGSTLDLGSNRARGSKALASAMLARRRSSIRHPILAGFRLFADLIWADRKALAAQALAFHRQRIPLERITASTLVLAGRDDSFATSPQRLHAAIPGSELVITRGNHSTALWKPAFHSAIVDFLA
ncbi:alpha/beta fold hydrolase [Halopseudomonas salegens]|uniref:Pimeloyl-ACP methyl ester carboxylesterase n=1 Tax=Halopseudomonas salegens TaxID=1434072 RepID=A0A1H2FZ25_9GAMM|nr:alpha/beta hydrolase [Halopseudomonas salegens]SDU12583.1 Pimeloyl-ACP methyl ester carboxylesterase [Halopseudomonas salegens]